MEKQILKEADQETRVQYLENNADQIVEGNYYQKLNQEDLVHKRSEFTANALAIDDLEEQKKEMLDDFKANLQPLKEAHKSLASEIRTGFEQKSGKLYKFIDHSTNFVHFYNDRGELIENKSRPAEAEELQKTIQMSLRAAL